MKKCPPGAICFENFTFIFLLAIIFIPALFYINKKTPSIASPMKHSLHSNQLYMNDINANYASASRFNTYQRPGLGFNTRDNDVLLNPYSPPLRDERYVMNDSPRGIPINVTTQGYDAEYRQVGILTRNGGQETILALMGKPLISNRDKWQYYTVSDTNNSVKLPITNKAKSCTSDQGCDKLYTGDMVYIQGYNDAFKVTNYDNNTMKYIPYI